MSYLTKRSVAKRSDTARDTGERVCSRVSNTEGQRAHSRPLAALFFLESAPNVTYGQGARRRRGGRPRIQRLRGPRRGVDSGRNDQEIIAKTAQDNDARFRLAPNEPINLRSSDVFTATELSVLEDL